MKKILLLLSFCFYSHLVTAQDTSDVGKVPISIYTPDTDDSLPDASISKLTYKVAQIVTSSGLTTAGYIPVFTIFSKFAVNDTKVVEGGMQNITVVDADITLFVKEINNTGLVASVTRPLKGSGATRLEAINNAISKISTGDEEYKKFINTCKNQILDFYNNNCEDILKKADNLAKEEDYEDAIALLQSVPLEAKGCHNSAQLKSLEVYKAYQEHTCKTLILAAKTFIASTEYNKVLDILERVDPSSPCGKEAEDLIKVTSQKVDKLEKKQWDLALQVYKDDIALEKERITAVKEIAIAVIKKDDKKSSKDHKTRKKTK